MTANAQEYIGIRNKQAKSVFREPAKIVWQSLHHYKVISGRITLLQSVGMPLPWNSGRLERLHFAKADVYPALKSNERDRKAKCDQSIYAVNDVFDMLEKLHGLEKLARETVWMYIEELFVELAVFMHVGRLLSSQTCPRRRFIIKWQFRDEN